MARKSSQRRHKGGPPGSGDPYLGDRNVREAASFHIVGMAALGAGIGFAAGGWFGFSLGLGAGVGAVVGYVLGSLFLAYYGGRQTR
jgi:hypothetical protein